MEPKEMKSIKTLARSWAAVQEDPRPTPRLTIYWWGLKRLFHSFAMFIGRNTIYGGL